MMMNTQEVEEMKEWKLIKEVSVSEESSSITIELENEYEEVEILCAIGGSDSNNAINNRTIMIDLYGNAGDKITSMNGNCIQSKGVNRLLTVSYRKNPYPICVSSSYNVPTLNPDGECAATHVSNGCSCKRSFSGFINKLVIGTFGNKGVIGIGSSVAVYGRQEATKCMQNYKTEY